VLRINSATTNLLFLSYRMNREKGKADASLSFRMTESKSQALEEFGFIGEIFRALVAASPRPALCG
jgi:hypothetical protein